MPDLDKLFTQEASAIVAPASDNQNNYSRLSTKIVEAAEDNSFTTTTTDGRIEEANLFSASPRRTCPDAMVTSLQKVDGEIDSSEETEKAGDDEDEDPAATCSVEADVQRSIGAFPVAGRPGKYSSPTGNGGHSLATVLENLPLPPVTAANSDDMSNTFLTALGHSHSFGPSDHVRNEALTSDNRRTHARHSSYEVPGSQTARSDSSCLPVQIAIGGVSGCLPGLSGSLSRTGTDASSFSSSFSISSLSQSDYSASLASIDDWQQHQQQQDGSSSKRSSLDRRSLASFCSTSSSNDDPNSITGAAGKPGQTSQNSGDSSNSGHRRLLPLTNILPRSLFSRKSVSISNNDQGEASSTTNSNNNNNTGNMSWKFRPPSLSSLTLLANHVNNHQNHINKDVLNDVPSTTALILENRPSNLPPKSLEEQQKHRQLYEQMIESVKKKEQREAKLRRKQQKMQLKQEDMLSAAVKEWTTEILPKWEDVRHSKRVRDLWGNGLPPCVRGKVWKLAVGNELSITEELFEICVGRAKERLRQFEEASLSNRVASPTASPDDGRSLSPTDKESPVDRESTVELIHLDVARTFPVLGIFQKGGPYYDLLLNVLGAYVCYRPDVGYVQGMSFLAAVLLLNMDASETFIVFANLMNRPCQLAFFRLRQAEMERYFLAYDRYFNECLPKLYAHFKLCDVRPNLYLIEWLYTLYAKSLPLEVTCRIWDVFFRDGEEFLFQTAIGILHHYEDQLLHSDFDRCVEFLTHLPENLKASDLFFSIEQSTPCLQSSLSLSLRHPGCSLGVGGEKRKRFMQIFNELAETASLALNCDNSPSSNADTRSGTPSMLFTYAANLLTSTSSLPSSRRESIQQQQEPHCQRTSSLHFDEARDADQSVKLENNNDEGVVCRL